MKIEGVWPELRRERPQEYFRAKTRRVAEDLEGIQRSVVEQRFAFHPVFRWRREERRRRENSVDR